MTGVWLISYIALWTFFVAVAVGLLGVMHNLGVVYESMAALSPKLKPAPTRLKAEMTLPDLRLVSLSGQPRSLVELRGDKMAITIVSQSCSSCRAFLSQLNRNGQHPDPLDPQVQRRALIVMGDVSGVDSLLREVMAPEHVPVFVDGEGQVASMWGISVVPATVIVDSEMRVVRQVFVS